VLAVNYRGSSGFGKNFMNAATREFAGKMHDDLIDAVNWAVKENVTTRDKVAIYGGSYGGYATLTGLTFTPDVFACGVDIVGPSNLITLIESFPAYWQPFLEGTWYKRVGDPRNEADRKMLLSRSPITKIDQLKKPLLIAQGANDPRVVQKESDQLVAAMKAKKIPVTYVLYPDEGHGFARPQNRTSFYAISEGFLAKCLGGRQEPIGSDFDGSSLRVLEGAEFVPGLADAAPKG
jgi:dipeptidyl aminopeptidase/acylaminoacyl peptidase